MPNDTKTCKYLKHSMEDTSKLKTSQGYCTKKAQNSAKACQNMNKSTLEYSQNELE